MKRAHSFSSLPYSRPTSPPSFLPERRSSDRPVSPASSIGSHGSGVSHPPGSRNGRRAQVSTDLSAGDLLDYVNNWNDGYSPSRLSRFFPVSPPRTALRDLATSGPHDDAGIRLPPIKTYTGQFDPVLPPPNPRSPCITIPPLIPLSGLTPNQTEYPTPTDRPPVGAFGPARFVPSQVDASPAPTATYKCHHPGCSAAPFQTQYLLNSHAFVHSQDRPHFCPIEGCRRGPGGKGFKRKNEMIRHGLVHNCPGYVCPFCPDQQHKYPRPDNLHRHVRVHHPDKSKDDPALRHVLTQRPEQSGRRTRRRTNAQ
ncbi:hypothetical protein BDV06DRAFT_138648 [Aspergillus oleicola]